MRAKVSVLYMPRLMNRELTVMMMMMVLMMMMMTHMMIV